MNGLFRDTLAELKARKILWLFGVFTLILVVVVLLTSNAQIRMESSGADMSIKDLNEMAGNPMLSMFAGFVSFLTFLAVASCCGVLPNMFTRGTAEFYLSKPISRVGLLTKKLIAMWLVYSGTIVLSAAIVLGTAFAVHGSFGSGVIWILVFELIALGIWLVILSFFSILSGSTVMTLMGVFILWIVQSLLRLREPLIEFVGSKPLDILLTVLYHITPKSSEIGVLAEQVALGQAGIDWMPLWSTLLLCVVIVPLTMMAFRRKDY